MLGLLVMAVKEEVLPKEESIRVIELPVRNNFRLSKLVIQKAISIIEYATPPKKVFYLQNPYLRKDYDN